MRKKMVLGLTGGMGSGKTIVAKIFETIGVPVYNSDLHARYLMNNDPQIRAELINHFGESVYLDDEKLNNTFLGKIVFKNKDELSWLNKLVHPIVRKDFETWLNDQKAELVIKESALLIETIDKQRPDKIILVTAPIELRITRIKNRDQLSEKEIVNRMSNQLSDVAKIPYADFIINNDGKHSLVQQVIGVYHSLTSHH